jgi:hypothetical protein
MDNDLSAKARFAILAITPLAVFSYTKTDNKEKTARSIFRRF